MFVAISFNRVLSHLKHRSPASYIALEYPETQTLIIEFYMEIAEAFATHPGTDQPTPRLCKSMNRHRWGLSFGSYAVIVWGENASQWFVLRRGLVVVGVPGIQGRDLAIWIQGWCLNVTRRHVGIRFWAEPERRYW